MTASPDAGAAQQTSGRRTMRAIQAAETRQRIIDAAVALYTERGYLDVGAADVAAAADVAHGLLFHYFGSMRGIYLEAMRGAAEQLVRAFDLSPGESPAAQLRNGLTAHVQYLSRHRGLALQLVLGGRGADPEAWEVFEAARWRLVEKTSQSMGADPNSHAVRLAGRSVIAAIDEATVYWLENGEPFSADDLVDWMVRMTFRVLSETVALDPSLADNREMMALLLAAVTEPRHDTRQKKAPATARSTRPSTKAAAPKKTRRSASTANLTSTSSAGRASTKATAANAPSRRTSHNVVIPAKKAPQRAATADATPRHATAKATAPAQRTRRATKEAATTTDKAPLRRTSGKAVAPTKAAPPAKATSGKAVAPTKAAPPAKAVRRTSGKTTAAANSASRNRH